MPFPTSPQQFAAAAAIVGTTIYVLGFLASFFLPEPDPKGLAE
jgi:hypothetical protein